jgi:hypothetical protein
MLDMLLTLIVYVVVCIKDFLGIFVFRPPSPAGYKIQIKQVDEVTKEVLNYI